MKTLRAGSFVLRHGTISEPEASRAAAAAVEAKAFSAVSVYAAHKDLATKTERFEIFRTYTKELWSRAYRYAKSRPEAAGTSRAAGPTALPPPAASSVGFAAFVTGVCDGASNCSAPK
jgi:hypothetical protein